MAPSAGLLFGAKADLEGSAVGLLDFPAFELVQRDPPQPAEVLRPIAHPQGRVERVHGTQQDRLVKLLRMEKISTMEGANEYLEKRYGSDYHVRFGRRALGADIHRQLPAKMDLRQILCFKEERTVGRDWCVCYQKRVLQIGSKHQSLALARQRVEVREHLDGTIELYYRGRVLAHYELPARPTGGQWRPVFQNNKVYRPPAEHPYKRGYVAPPAQHGNVTVLMS